MLEKIALANRILELNKRSATLEERFAKDGEGGAPAASGPTASDVHVPAAMGGGKKKEKKVAKDDVKKADTASCGAFVAAIMHAATVAHIMHLQTRSYAEHKALDDLYSGLPGLIDDFAEACQGRYGIITGYPASVSIPQENPLDFVRSLQVMVDGQRVLLPQDSHLQNIVDEIAALIDSAAYKLAFLS